MAFALVALLLFLGVASAAPPPPQKADVKFSKNYAVRWRDDHTRKMDSGKELHLVLDKDSGAGFGSTKKFLFGHISMKIKLVPGDSAGTVTAFYMSSETENHDELDFEFLGNRTGEPYTVQTNVFANGVGEREQRVSLWFDPTADFHSYSLVWNQKQITFYIDDVPIRVFKNNEAAGIPYPKSQPMGVYSSLWNGDDWATRGGLEKIDWTEAPFVAAYRGFTVDACSGTVQACTRRFKSKWWDQAAYQTTDSDTKSRLQWVQQNHMIYDYCTDSRRNPTPPAECALNV